MAAAGETPALTGRGYCRAGEGARATHIIQDVPSLGSAVLGHHCLGCSNYQLQITQFTKFPHRRREMIMTINYFALRPRLPTRPQYEKIVGLIPSKILLVEDGTHGHPAQ